MPEVVGYDDRMKRRVTCENCTAIIEYVENDIQESTGRYYSGDIWVVEWVKCPNCGKQAVIRTW